MLRFFTWKFGVALPCSNHSHELSGQRMRVTPLQLYRTVLTARDCTVRMCVCVCVCVLVLHATKQEAFVIRWSNESRRGISQHITVTSRFTSQPSCESRVSNTQVTVHEWSNRFYSPPRSSADTELSSHREAFPARSSRDQVAVQRQVQRQR